MPALPERIWREAEPAPLDWRSAFKGSPVLAQLLWNRGIRTQEEAELFLAPSWESGRHDAHAFRHLDQALELVIDMLGRGERIVVHGDYDADGVTGSTVLITTLREIERCLDGARAESCVTSYIPHRDKEGYGLHERTVSTLAEQGVKLIITVDCGIASVAEIAKARALGIPVIVVDHHEFGEVLPDGLLIHPGLPEETYPFRHLAAVGVSFKFAEALLQRARERGCDIPVGWEKWLLDLVAIATVTDMVSLTGENRVLERFGLKVLNKTRRPGLLALMEEANLQPGKIDTEAIGFMIGPRINAAGRMDHASLALKLMLAESIEEARVYAKELERCNTRRQDVSRKMSEEVKKYLEKGYGSAIFFWDEAWSPALVGLVAGRVHDQTARPTFLMGYCEGQWIGSGRGPVGFNVAEAMRTVGDGILTRVGGHAQACGFALRDASLLPELRDRLEKYTKERFDAERARPALAIDASIALRELSWETWEELQAMEPFGQGNPRPTFIAKRILMTRAERFGGGDRHARFVFIDENGRSWRGIAFQSGEMSERFPMNSWVDVVFQLSRNEWQGRSTLELRVLDLRLANQ